MTRRIGIIGAGPGGLAAAMLLAASGAAVTIHERAGHTGGRSATRTSQDGEYRFDTGPTFFLYPEILREIFASCGLDLDEHVELIRLDPQYRLRFEDGESIAATSDIARMQAELARLDPADAKALPRYLADNEAKLEAFRPALQMPFDSLASYLAPPVLRALGKLRPWRSVDADLARFFGDERIRLAFSFQSKYLGMSPFRCPSMFTILAYMEYAHGVFHPRGGCGAVMTAMERAARSLGVNFALDDEVLRIETDRGRATGLHTRTGRHDYDAIVLNADFAHAMTHLLPDADRRKWNDRRIARARFSCSTFMLYLGLDRRYDALDHHTIHLARDYKASLAAIEDGRAPENPSFYVQNASVTDDSLAPAGHSTIYALVPVGHLTPHSPDWPAHQARYRGLVIDRLKSLGLPDIERHIRYERITTPVDWHSELAVHQGATFNLAHNLGQMMHNRPHNRFEDVDGLYLVGGGTHPGSGLPVIFESARISARLIAEALALPMTTPARPVPAAARLVAAL